MTESEVVRVSERDVLQERVALCAVDLGEVGNILALARRVISAHVKFGERNQKDRSKRVPAVEICARILVEEILLIDTET